MLKFSGVSQYMNMKLWLKFQENLRLHVSKLIFSEGFYKKWLLTNIILTTLNTLGFPHTLPGKIKSAFILAGKNFCWWGNI